MKKYFFFDIDQTLLAGPPQNQYIPKSALSALDQLQKNGHFAAIATSRGQAMAVDVMHKFGLRNMVSDGGNGITIDDELIELHALDHAKCASLILECKEKGISWGITPENKNIRLVPDEQFMKDTQDFWLNTVIVDSLCLDDYPNIYKMSIACNEIQEQKLDALRNLPYARYCDVYVMVEPTNKEAGIYRMMERLGGDLKDVVVFGDGENDLSMFRPEWMSIAMRNGAETLKKQADYVTEEPENDGIYNACKHFGWI